jgi:predicted nucleic acid-binding protein
MKDYGLNFDDALAVQALKELSTDTIVSYDDDFDLVEGVKRRIPEDML